MTPAPFATKRSVQTDRTRNARTVSEEAKEPASTLVLNFSKYCYKWSTVQGKRIVPLKEQYAAMSGEIYKHGSVVRFIAAHLYGTEEERTIHLLHPSFDKSAKLDSGSLELENVVVRVDSKSDSKLDLVVQGNFEMDDKTHGWDLMVTKVLLMSHTGRYVGEIDAKCRICAIVKDESEFYLNAEGKEVSRRSLGADRPFVTPELITRLVATYPVLRPRETAAVLKDWSDFLDMRDLIAGLNGENGFKVRRPEFIQACYGPVSSIPADKTLVDDGITAWTDDIQPGLPQCTLVRVVHDMDPVPTGGELRAYVDAFNAATKGIVKVVNPSIEGEEYDADPDDRKRDRDMSLIGERIAEVRTGRTLTSEDTRDLDSLHKTETDSIRKEYADRAEKDAAAALEAYKSSEDLAEELDRRVGASEESIRAAAGKLRRGKAEEAYLDLMEKGGSPDWESVYAEVSLDDCLDEVTAGFRKREADGILDGKFKDLSREAASRLRPEMELELRNADSRHKARLSELARKLSKSSLTVFFKIPAEEGKSVTQDVKDRTAYFADRGGLVLVEDDAAERSSVDRQRLAINDLIYGTMRNPYLISFLYSPEITPLFEPAEVSHTFGKRFNDLQMRAINGAVSANGLYLIQGPPGTGKTQVIAEITAQEVIRGHKVLIASQGNKAVDNAFERLRPYSFIRPVRIMAENRESAYELRNIVSTVYDGIRTALEERMDLFGDAESRAAISEKISEFKRFYTDVYLSRKSEAESLIRKVRAVRRELNERLDKVNCENAALDSARKRYYDACDKLKRLDDFEKEDYSEFASEIRAMFPNAERDSEIFGPDGLCRTVMSVSEDEMYDLIERYEGMRDRGELPDDRFSSLFKDGGRRLPEIKFSLDGIRGAVRGMAESDRDEAEKASRYDPKRSDEIRKVFGSKMQSYMENEAYVSYLEAESKAQSMVSELFSKLRVTDRYDTIEEARQIVAKEEKVLEAFGGQGAEATLKTLEQMRDYLREEGVEGIDSDQLIDMLTGYVNVVGMTCTAKDNVRRVREREGPEIDLRKMGADVVIIDEVSKVPFPELVRPMSYGKKIILVGDHKQLPPVYNEKAEDDDLRELSRKYARMYTEPLFKRLFEEADVHSKTMLRTQYRMTSQIMGVINRFYDGELEMPEGVPERMHGMTVLGKTRPIITPEGSVVFIDCKGKERRESGSTSYVNDSEAETVSRMVRLIDAAREGFDETLTMGVITPYADQMRMIRRMLRMDDERSPDRLRLRNFLEKGEERFMVKSVDDFQGDERDVIILSLVRTTESRFISDFRRINVAMSRARRLLVIVGNADSLADVAVDVDGDGTLRNVYKDIIDDLKMDGRVVDSEEVPE
jgi:hypothetical protein